MLLQRVGRRGDDHCQQLMILQGKPWINPLGWQPAIEAVPAGVLTRVLGIAWTVKVPAVLQSLEVLPHVVAAPGRIAGELRDPVPVTAVRIDSDEGVMRRAAADRSRPRI